MLGLGLVWWIIEVLSSVGYLVRRLVGANESFLKVYGELSFSPHLLDLSGITV